MTAGGKTEMKSLLIIVIAGRLFQSTACPDFRGSNLYGKGHYCNFTPA